MNSPVIEKVRSTDGTTIVVDVAGSGDPVVLVGGACTTRTAMAGLLDQLAGQFTVYNYDRRGRGESGDRLPYSVEREFEDLRAVIELAGGTAAAFGSSSGAILAMRAAAAGVPVSRLAMWEPPFIVDDSRPPLPADYAEHINDLLAGDRRGEVITYFMTAAVLMPDEMVGPMRQSPFWAELETLAHTIVYDAAVTGSFAERTIELSRVDVCTLVLDGGMASWMSAGADAAAAELDLGWRKTLTGQTHDFDPAVLAPPVAAFFAAPQS